MLKSNGRSKENRREYNVIVESIIENAKSSGQSFTVCVIFTKIIRIIN